MSRVPYEQLIAYAAGDLRGDEADRVRRQLEVDEEAAATVARYRLTAERLAEDDSVSPPDHALASAKAIFRPVSEPRGTTWLERLDALIATIVFDSRLQPALVRTAGSIDRVQLAFEVDDVDVDVVAERVDRDGPWTITGQVAGPRSVDGLDVALTEADSVSVVEQTTTDDRGVFTLEVAPGAYDIRLRSGRTIVLPDVRLE